MKLDENHLDKKNILQQRAVVLLQKKLMEERIAKQVIYSYDTVRKYMNARSVIDICFLFQDGLYSCANEDLDVERAEKETLYNLKPGELGKNRIKESVARD
ncbi:MAG: hypothetical protein VX737_06530 [Pseudomonadota bacterium]|nr:hypothetical protein [Pseudomonadota bacterium]